MRTPDADEYIHSAMKELRADLKQRIIFGPAGRAVVHSAGERVLLAPNGESFRIIELPEGGSQFETDHSLHAHIRPRTHRLRLVQ